MKAKVVWAAQAETLLANLAASPEWDLQVAKLGDHEGRTESSLVSLPEWDGLASGVREAFVCTPMQFDNARKLLPDARVWWVIHNGRGNLIDRGRLDEISHVVAFSNQVVYWERKRLPGLHYHVLQLSYEAVPTWRYLPNVAWTMRNRPSTRTGDSQAIWDAIVATSGKASSCSIFGQGQPLGFLDPAKKKAFTNDCSCYLSGLPMWAGFGLAEHEAMAAGCPVVGTIWGDLMEDGGLPGLHATPQEAGAYLRRILEDEEEAVRCSEAGLAYIRGWRTNMRRDHSIRGLLQTCR